MKLELSEPTKKELTENYDRLLKEIAVKIDERDVLGDEVIDMQSCIDAINTLIGYSLIDIPDVAKGEKDG